MAGSARIGALHVMLGLDSAEFSAGLNKADSGLSKFAQSAKVGLAIVATAALAAGTALAVAVKGAIDNADELSKTAQKVGFTTEALSRLNYAASLSDVALGQLSTGLGRLTAGMSQIAQGTGGQAKMAFDALGIAALDANGKLRDSDQVFADIAERFGRMEDGSTKTALAIALFGRAGADLIPMLNMGKAGLADLAAEADRLGITLGTDTGHAAEQFNDSITRMQATLQGVVNKIMAGALPALNDLGDKVSDPQFAASAQAIGQAIVDSLRIAVDAINTTVSAFNGLRDAMNWVNTHDMFGNEMKPKNEAGRQFIKFNSPEEAKQILRDKLAAGDTKGPGSDFYSGMFGASAPEIAASSEQVATSFEPVIANTKAAAAGASALSKAMGEGKAVFDATRTPAEAYGLEVQRLNLLLSEGAINQDTYRRAVKQAQDALTAAQQTTTQTVDIMGELKSTASDLGSTLVDAFMSGENAGEAFFKSAMNGLGNLTGKLVDMASNGLFDLLANAFSGGIGGGSTLKLGYNGIPGFATGTNNAPGGLAMVGERGPELVNLPRGSQVIPNDLLGGGRQSLDVHVSLDNEMLMATVYDASGKVVAAATPGIAKQGAAAAGSALGKGDFDSSMRRFGSTPQAKRR